jgi:hypothetical protein
LDEPPIEEEEHPLVAELKSVDINRLTPLEALQLLAKWQQDIKEGQ